MENEEIMMNETTEAMTDVENPSLKPKPMRKNRAALCPQRY